MAECIFQRWQHQYLYPACSYVTGIANPLSGGTDYFSTLVDVGGPSDCCNPQITEVYCGSSVSFWFGNFCLLEGLLWWKPVTMKNHKWCLKYLLLVRSQAMSLCFTNSLKTLLQPPCLRLAIEAIKLQGTISWFFMPIST